MREENCKKKQFMRNEGERWEKGEKRNTREERGEKWERGEELDGRRERWERRERNYDIEGCSTQKGVRHFETKLINKKVFTTRKNSIIS